ncbi:hypothetical protein PAAG_01080 [Paracoccidioides lutzii Pb01]|uniref:Uncharacterized protein n=1 Tax=Paracoccidioides lutzii (strain ATCC MYA-826 / Pb01) TaxID=502779 RepID=C1GRD5_PARBA|nr:hypothetical protein PAAG_01080 [Paracoccidioides lutzii Pb01]EEH38159.2 hypothetical protein PAAG_01080 [Paracoccidioides lutzii Pb01]
MAHQNAPRCEMPSWYYTDPIQRELSAILNGLKQDLSFMGCTSLGRDGVLRSLTADRDVVDAAGLTPDQIAAFIRRYPAGLVNEAEFTGVDGTKVPKELWFAPNKNILPPPLSNEAKQLSRKVVDENHELFHSRREELKQKYGEQEKGNDHGDNQADV